MDLMIVIDTDNDAFVGNTKREAARILRDFAEHLCNSSGHPLPNFHGTKLRDFNGNIVGHIEVRPRARKRGMRAWKRETQTELGDDECMVTVITPGLLKIHNRNEGEETDR